MCYANSLLHMMFGFSSCVLGLKSKIVIGESYFGLEAMHF
jgi:hypothetical protein